MIGSSSKDALELPSENQIWRAGKYTIEFSDFSFESPISLVNVYITTENVDV